MGKILVIDDGRPALDLIQTILMKALPEYKILMAETATRGLELAIAEKPDTIILDIALPDHNGLEFCKELKANDQIGSTPILMISALGYDAGVRVKALKSGADGFVTKPFDRFEFVGLVKVMLRISHAEEILRQQNESLTKHLLEKTKEFHDHEDRYAQISEHDRLFFWETDQSGSIVYLSRGAEIILGYSLSELIGRKYFSLFELSTEMDRLKQVLIRDLKNQYSFKDVEYLIRHKTGHPVWMSMSGFPLINSGNRFDGYRGISHDITKRKEIERDLTRSQEKIKSSQIKLKNLHSALNIAEEKERRRISEYLHDGLGATLAIANLKLSSIFQYDLPEKVIDVIKDSTGLILDAIKDSRSLTYELCPPILYELGLIPAIKWKLEQMEKQSRMRSQLFVTGEIPEIEYDLRIFLYRTISELLLNVLKHSGGELVEVEVICENNEIILSVFDNGQGVDGNPLTRNETTDGFGLFSIQERIETLQGSIIIESATDEYTKVQIRVPV